MCSHLADTRNRGELTAKLRTDVDDLVTTLIGFGDDVPPMAFGGDLYVRAERQVNIYPQIPMIMAGLHQVSHLPCK